MFTRIKIFCRLLWYTCRLACTSGFLCKEKLYAVSPERTLHYSSHEKRKLAALQGYAKKGAITYPVVLNLLAHQLFKAQSESDRKLTKRYLIELNHMTRYWLARL
jgi:hypothetical protein